MRESKRLLSSLREMQQTPPRRSSCASLVSLKKQQDKFLDKGPFPCSALANASPEFVQKKGISWMKWY
jgi:hypothetical protein